jgi:hypothetical protein
VRGSPADREVPLADTWAFPAWSRPQTPRRWPPQVAACEGATPNATVEGPKQFQWVHLSPLPRPRDATTSLLTMSMPSACSGRGGCSAEHFSVARRPFAARLDLTVNFARFVRQQNGDAVSDWERQGGGTADQLPSYWIEFRAALSRRDKEEFQGLEDPEVNRRRPSWHNHHSRLFPRTPRFLVGRSACQPTLCSPTANQHLHAQRQLAARSKLRKLRFHFFAHGTALFCFE